MNGKEIKAQINHQRTSTHCIVKWWRKENDFVDYELLDRFLEACKPDEEFAEFELLNLEQMWTVLAGATRDKMEREPRRGKEVVVWQRVDSKGQKEFREFPFAAEPLLEVFDEITKGNVIE
ncbi:MAG TPA: hypothetical protein VJ955_04325 [Desulfuromonadales bacterium]|nr:hypothetical protein [Desulfuromonadales bacterium]